MKIKTVPNKYLQIYNLCYKLTKELKKKYPDHSIIASINNHFMVKIKSKVNPFE
jgi:hypothetical protein